MRVIVPSIYSCVFAIDKQRKNPTVTAFIYQNWNCLPQSYSVLFTNNLFLQKYDAKEAFNTG